jgi:glutathione S-transferase
MTLRFHYHPLSSFCWKVLIALYEKGVKFEPVMVNLGDPESEAAFRKLSPMRKMPALEDVERGVVVNESSIQIEYLDRILPALKLIPADALDVRYWDRFFDLYVHIPMQRIVADRLRPADKKDPFGVSETRAALRSALDVLETHMKGREWVSGDAFSMADCAALPALYYGDKVLPFEKTHPNAFAYLKRLSARPVIARVIKEAEPYAHFFPREETQIA